MTVADPTLELETRAFASGADVVIGCDEVGRGALAGPVFVGAVVMTPGTPRAFPAGLRDSKMLSPRRRELLEPAVRRWAAAWALGERRPDQIDRDGIVACLGAAAADAVRAVLAAMGMPPGRAVVILDGSQDWLGPLLADLDVTVVVRPKADRDCVVVAAASVLAKVARDRLLIEGGACWPAYDWARNKGYGSAAHRAAISRDGACPWHRRTWIHAEPGLVSDSSPAANGARIDTR